MCSCMQLGALAAGGSEIKSIPPQGATYTRGPLRPPAAALGLWGRARREEAPLNWPALVLLHLKEGHLDWFAASGRTEAGTMTTVAVAGTYVKLR
jgi:hypothetical protein